jgi:hypothetical protein
MIIIPSHVTFVILQIVGISDSGHLFLCVVKVCTVMMIERSVWGVCFGYQKFVLVEILYTDGIPRYVFNNLYISPTCLLAETCGK